MERFVAIVDGAHQVGSQIKVKDCQRSLQPGDTIYFDGVTHIDHNALKRFAVVRPFLPNENGTGVLDIFPPIIPSGWPRNVSNSPANQAIVIPDMIGA